MFVLAFSFSLLVCVRAFSVFPIFDQTFPLFIFSHSFVFPFLKDLIATEWRPSIIYLKPIPCCSSFLNWQYEGRCLCEEVFSCSHYQVTLGTSVSSFQFSRYRLLFTSGITDITEYLVQRVHSQTQTQTAQVMDSALWNRQQWNGWRLICLF